MSILCFYNRQHRNGQCSGEEKWKSQNITRGWGWRGCVVLIWDLLDQVCGLIKASLWRGTNQYSKIEQMSAEMKYIEGKI